MKNLEYQQRAVTELIDKTIRLLNAGGQRNKMVFEATTGAGKTVMACLMLAGLMDELHDRGDSRYQEVAFIWFAPRKLHIQSYEKLKEAFEETRTLRPVMFDELDQNEGIRPGEILFVNWESVNKESNVMVRENESFASLYEIARRTQEEYDLPIVAIIDEEHMFWSKTADKSAAVLERINPAVELRISATPKTLHPDEKVKVYRQDVIAAEMIKKEVVLNPDIELDFSEERTLNENLIKAALAKRNQLAELYQELGVKIIILNGLHISYQRLKRFILYCRNNRILFQLCIQIQRTVLLYFNLILLHLLIRQLKPCPEFFHCIQTRVCCIYKSSVFQTIELFLLIISGKNVNQFFL